MVVISYSKKKEEEEEISIDCRELLQISSFVFIHTIILIYFYLVFYSKFIDSSFIRFINQK